MSDTIKAEGFGDAELARFAHWQGVSYAVLAEVMEQLTVGVTEREAARVARAVFRREGADRFFHLPVALFGARAALPDPWRTGDFTPTDRALAVGDSVILDASPTFEGYVVDTSISQCFRGSAARSSTDATLAHASVQARRVAAAVADHHAALVHNLGYRSSILEAVRARATFRETAAAVDACMRSAGYENRHRLHPGEVLGHRVVRFSDVERLPPVDAHGFDTHLFEWFAAGVGAAIETGSVPPTWGDVDISDHRPASGLWAVEPHLGRGDTGVKWEELLVITDSDAYWLSDDVPHVRDAATR